jgi:hypothetical protein
MLAGRQGILVDPMVLRFVARPKRLVLVGSKSTLGLSGTSLSAVLSSRRPRHGAAGRAARDRRGKREPAGWDDSLNVTFAVLPEAPLGAGPSAGFGMSRPSPSTRLRARGASGPAPEGRGDASNGIRATLYAILRRYHEVNRLQVVAPVNFFGRWICSIRRVRWIAERGGSCEAVLGRYLSGHPILDSRV